jgi:hypothetical protein
LNRFHHFVKELSFKCVESLNRAKNSALVDPTPQRAVAQNLSLRLGQRGPVNRYTAHVCYKLKGKRKGKNPNSKLATKLSEVKSQHMYTSMQQYVLTPALFALNLL